MAPLAMGGSIRARRRWPCQRVRRPWPRVASPATPATLNPTRVRQQRPHKWERCPQPRMSL
eukprot:13479856-Alexandrium_andersonii.AAC.1